MPYAFHNGVRIYWEEEGSGEPLLMIMGLSFPMAMWGELRGVLAKNFRTILLDNRGAGNSDVPARHWNMAQMAEDAACVLDAAGVRTVDLIGVSMGGMIAQELTLQHPERVRKLILGCTACGGFKAVLPDARALYTLGSPFMTREARLRAVLPLIYDPHTPQERIDADIARLKGNAPSERGYLQQFAAILPWHSYDRLPRIHAPALVIHGETDGLVPPANAPILADRISGAKLKMIPQASHMFHTDQPEITRDTLLEFLKEDSYVRS